MLLGLGCSGMALVQWRRGAMRCTPLPLSKDSFDRCPTAWRLRSTTVPAPRLALALADLLGVGCRRKEPSQACCSSVNSFLYAAGSPLLHWRDDTVTDLKTTTAWAACLALLKAFLVQAGLDHDVHLETRGGSGLDFHVEHKQAVLGRRLGRGVDARLQHASTQAAWRRDAIIGGDDAPDGRKLPAAAQPAGAGAPDGLTFRAPTRSHRRSDCLGWQRPVGHGARRCATAYDQTAAGTPGVSVIPVGETWERAMRAPAWPTPTLRRRGAARPVS